MKEINYTTKVIALSIPGSLIAGIILNFLSDLSISTIIIILLIILILILFYLLYFSRNNEEKSEIGINNIYTTKKNSFSKIVENANNSFFFLGISAKRTNSSPIIQKKIIEIGRKNGEIRFLLLDPDSENVKKRADDEKDDYNSWKNEINATITRLKSLEKKHNITIQIRVFDEYPVWRMNIIDSNKIYLNYFLLNKQGAQSPQIELIENDNSIFWPLFNTYNELWKKSKVV